jgi:hypothetical protein
MIHRTIKHMKTRPHHERRAFALMIALGVIVVLFLCWSFFFFSSLQGVTPINNSTGVTATTTQE